MNFNKNLVLWMCIMVLTKLTEAGECVQRRLGACKVLNVNAGVRSIFLKDFHSPQPEGFALQTSIEINLLQNKHSVENNLPVEEKRPIGYNLDNAALVAIEINMADSYTIRIYLGKKYYRLAEFKYYDDSDYLIKTKYSSYTPILPTFPYNLHLEMTTNGTFSVYADANTEPFLQHQLNKRPTVNNIAIDAHPDQTDLIAFLDCSETYKPNCGSHRVDRLYGCREWFVEEKAVDYITKFEGFQKTYENHVLFDEFVVVDIAEYSSRMRFSFSDALLKIEFKVKSIKVVLYTECGRQCVVLKDAETTKWPQIPGGPYAVHVIIESDTNNNRLTISNIRGDEILALNLCGVKGRLEWMSYNGPKFYFDCLHPDHVYSTMTSDRPRKTNEKDNIWDLTYHENGYNFSKTFLDTRQFVSEPFVLYTHKIGKSTEDWCEGKPQPKLFLISGENDDPLQAVIKSSNRALLTELEKIGNTTAVTNAAVLSELHSVKASIDALATHLERHTTSVNYNYYNQLNVTEFLKLIKQN